MLLSPSNPPLSPASMIPSPSISTPILMTAAIPRRRRRHRFCGRRNRRFRHRSADSAFFISADTAAYSAVMYTVAELPRPRLFLCRHIGLLCSCLVPARRQNLDRFRRLHRFSTSASPFACNQPITRRPKLSKFNRLHFPRSTSAAMKKAIHFSLPQTGRFICSGNAIHSLPSDIASLASDMYSIVKTIIVSVTFVSIL